MCFAAVRIDQPTNHPSNHLASPSALSQIEALLCCGRPFSHFSLLFLSYIFHFNIRAADVDLCVVSVNCKLTLDQKKGVMQMLSIYH